jgi:hypothetical protein
LFDMHHPRITFTNWLGVHSFGLLLMTIQCFSYQTLSFLFSIFHLARWIQESCSCKDQGHLETYLCEVLNCPQGLISCNVLLYITPDGLPLSPLEPDKLAPDKSTFVSLCCACLCILVFVVWGISYL